MLVRWSGLKPLLNSCLVLLTGISGEPLRELLSGILWENILGKSLDGISKRNLQRCPAQKGGVAPERPYWKPPETDGGISGRNLRGESLPCSDPEGL